MSGLRKPNRAMLDLMFPGIKGALNPHAHISSHFTIKRQFKLFLLRRSLYKPYRFAMKCYKITPMILNYSYSNVFSNYDLQNLVGVKNESNL